MSAQGSSAFVDVNTVLEEHVRRRPDKVFIQSPDQGSRITFGEFEALTRRFVDFLAREGIRHGDRISLLSDNGIEPLIVFWGGLRAGVIVNAINVEIREKHVSQILHDVAPKAVFWSRELVSDPRALGTGGAPWFAFGAWNAPAPAADDLFGRLRRESAAPVTTRPARTDWSLINYTSGTTDAPKGAIWTHEAYYAMCESPVDRLELGEADTILDYRHFSWSSPQILSVGPTMLTGATLVLARKFSQARFFDWLRDYRVTVSVGIPNVIIMQPARLRVLAGPGPARADSAGRLPQRRSRQTRRRGLHLHHRPQEGHHHQGRRQHRLARDHELPARASGRRRRRHARRARRHLRRGPGRIRGAASRAKPRRSGAPRALPRAARGLQGAGRRPHRRRRAEERQRQARPRRPRRGLAARGRTPTRVLRFPWGMMATIAAPEHAQPQALTAAGWRALELFPTAV